MPSHRIQLLIVIVDLAAGTGTFTRSLGGGLRRLYPDEFEVRLLTLRPQQLSDADRAHFDRADSLDTPVHDDWRKTFELPLAVRRLKKFLANDPPDLIFAVHTFSNVVCSSAAGSIPVILSDHLNMSAWLTRARFGKLTAAMMRRAYRGRLMVGASRELVADSIANFGATRGEVVPNGIDASMVRKKAAAPTPDIPRLAADLSARSSEVQKDTPASRGLNEVESALHIRKPYFVAVGRLTAQKDFATLIRAFAIAKKGGLTEDLLIAGEGEQRPSLESLIVSLGLQSSVSLLGQLPNPYPLIAGAKCLVLSSIWEGFAYVPVEAMALGVPCVCTDCPSGPAEILGNGTYGLLAKPEDPESLADAILKVGTDDATRAHFAKQAEIRAAQLSIENMTRSYREIFRREAATNSRPAG